MAAANQPIGTQRGRVAFLLFAFAVALLPLGLGGNRPLPFGLLQLALSISAVLVFTDGTTLQNVFWPRRIKIALAGFAVVAIWAAVQTLPILPASFAHPLWQDAAATLGRDVPASIALDHAAAWHALQRYITYILLGVLAYIFGHNQTRATQLTQILFAVGAVVTLYGIALYAAGVQQVLWLPKWAHKHDITGTFVDRNHFAVYTGMTLLCGFALLWQRLRSTIKNLQRHQYADALQGFAMRYGVPILLLLLTMLIAILFSHSRAGLLATLAGALAFICAYLFYQRRRAMAFVIPGALTVAIILFFATAGHQMGRFDRLFIDNSSRDRLKVYETTLDAIDNSPWLGYGLGNFETTFRLFRGTDIGMNFDRAHSDWLESVFELGVPFGLILWASIALLITGCLHGIRVRRQHGMHAALALGASCIVLLHAAVEFSLQMPGVVAVWVALLATGLAQSWGSAERS